VKNLQRPEVHDRREAHTTRLATDEKSVEFVLANDILNDAWIIVHAACVQLCIAPGSEAQVGTDNLRRSTASTAAERESIDLDWNATATFSEDGSGGRHGGGEAGQFQEFASVRSESGFHVSTLWF
jgi:hypothetical protein